MVVRKILSQEKSFKKKLKIIAQYLARVRGAKKTWDKRHSSVLNKNPQYKKRCNNKVENKHQNLWSPFRKNCDLTTLRLCKNISGIEDPRFVPEDVFVSDIEPTLITDTSVDYIGIKSFYNRWFEKGIFPADIFHRVDGQYLDPNLNAINREDLAKIANGISYPVVLKPNKDTYGGKGIEFPKNEGELLRLATDNNNYVVQNMIKQHEFFEQFNRGGINTVKVFVYRSVRDNKVHVLSSGFRMGRGGSLDNETAGGIITYIRDDGTMNGYAVDKYGTKYSKHPDSKLAFNFKLPDYEGLISLSKRIGEKVFYTRIIGLDACFDENGDWRILEVNTFSQGIRVSQYGGAPFFGKFTDEVIDFCKKNHWALCE